MLELQFFPTHPMGAFEFIATFPKEIKEINLILSSTNLGMCAKKGYGLQYKFD